MLRPPSSSSSLSSFSLVDALRLRGLLLLFWHRRISRVYLSKCYIIIHLLPLFFKAWKKDRYWGLLQTPYPAAASSSSSLPPPSLPLSLSLSQTRPLPSRRRNAGPQRGPGAPDRDRPRACHVAAVSPSSVLPWRAGREGGLGFFSFARFLRFRFRQPPKQGQRRPPATSLPRRREDRPRGRPRPRPRGRRPGRQGWKRRKSVVMKMMMKTTTERSRSSLLRRHRLHCRRCC